ncbi:hypothetical protein DH2020_001637 [Rehmannia glutinosa]|uniref:Uncharacterized protein n=1 Tax=Rehmannia glutinosa TaxID=99300 RepID=A0ABR0Y0E5_REHGL
MDENRVLFDASAYMLFEASGDSESQHFDGALEPESGAAAATTAEDDAQSCSYGSVSDCSRMRTVDPGEEDFRGADFNDSGGEEEDDGGGGWSVDEEDDGVVDQCCRRGTTGAAVKEKPKKSKRCQMGRSMPIRRAKNKIGMDGPNNKQVIVLEPSTTDKNTKKNRPVQFFGA